MGYIFGAIIFLFGAALGSFIAVIANRFNTGMSFLKGHSICFSCNTELSNKDLIPIFSFLFLRGKCRYCQSKIPVDTLIVEIAMGILLVIAALKTGIFDNFQFLIFNFQLISNFLILTAIFAVIFLISKGTWFGFGDVKYILVLGFFLGLSQGLSAVILAFWIGAVFSIIALSLKRLTPHINLPLFKNNLTIKSEIPFGPFLSLGIIISFCLSLDLFQIHEIFNTF